MANKRIELEQYKHYIDLLQEEPNRKKWRKGIQMALITAVLLALAIFVLGMMSGSLATLPRNVLDPPPARQPATQPGTTPGGTENAPVNPGGQVPINPGGQVPINPGGQTPSPGGKAPSAPLASRADYGIPLGARDGTLIAQAQGVPDQPAPVEFQQTAPGTAPGQQAGKKAKSTGPGEETKGVGNLSKLANGAGGRGFQIYLLVLFITLAVVLYLPIRKARLEGKSK
jgi:hypothetical protein